MSAEKTPGGWTYLKNIGRHTRRAAEGGVIVLTAFAGGPIAPAAITAEVLVFGAVEAGLDAHRTRRLGSAAPSTFEFQRPRLSVQGPKITLRR